MSNYGIDIREYGAVGDFIEFDDDAIAAAMTVARRQGAPLFVPPGHYRLERPTDFDFTRVTAKGLMLGGVGCGQSILEWVGMPDGVPACRMHATADWYDLNVAALSFRSSHRGPTLALGRDDFADPLNVATFDGLSVLNSCEHDDAVAIRANYVVNSNFIGTRANAFANGAGTNKGTALLARQVAFCTFTNGSYGNAKYGMRFVDGFSFGNVSLAVDLENVDHCISNESPNAGRNTWVGGQFSLWETSALRAPAGLSGDRITVIQPNRGDDDSDPFVDPVYYQGIRVIDGTDVATPTLPASGAPVTNKTGKRVMVLFWGGSVSSISINGFVVGTATAAVVLLPGESIAVNYSSPPSWWWRPAE